MASIKFLGVEKIVSGGQTGVDRAALDAAIKLGIPHGGWCPRGRLAEDGPIAAVYQLLEHPSGDYSDRTQQNVVDSDATLILYKSRLSGGTALTNRLAKQLDKPLLRVRLDCKIDFARIASWLRDNNVKVLNVAGPRGSSDAELHPLAFQMICKLFNSTGSLSDFC